MPRRTTNDPAIAQRIRERRTLLGWTVRFAANRAGISHSTWSRIERGAMSADNRFTLAAIAEALRCPVSTLTKLPDPINRSEAETGGAAYETMRAIIDADLAYQPPAAPAQPIAALQRELDLVHDLEARCDYTAATKRLPDLLRGLHASASGPDRAAALRALIIAELIASYAMRWLGHPASTWLAADRARQAAEALDDPVLLGVASFARAHAAIVCGLFDRGLTIAEYATRDLEPHVGTPEAPEVYGQVLLMRAFSLYALGRRDDAWTSVAEAQRIADRTGDTTTLGLMFGPSNIRFWKIAMEADGDSPGRAVEIARTTNSRAVPKVARQAAFYLDTARALAHVRKDSEALRMLLTAERLAPQRMRAPLVRETARGILERARRGTGWTELRGLCERLGVGA
jgi:transcriptional regulator with XRE-family HTH domain